MSRIGMNPVEVPDDVEVLISGQQVTVKGKLGELKGVLAPEVTVTREDKRIWIKPRSLLRRPIDAYLLDNRT
ncbi:MAG TPA: 50S ribosomal protein L6 [Alphaproteobacteria bacterium]|nr:50S ribosomal protein L6 [Alphaproteobacteria bacterium]